LAEEEHLRMRRIMPLFHGRTPIQIEYSAVLPNGWAGALAFAPMMFLSSRAAGAVGF